MIMHLLHAYLTMYILYKISVRTKDIGWSLTPQKSMVMMIKKMY